MRTIGYAEFINRRSLPVRPLARPAEISGSVNRRVDSADRVLFPRGVAIEDTPVGHLEFALRHEGVNLEVIDALVEHLQPWDTMNPAGHDPDCTVYAPTTCTVSPRQRINRTDASSNVDRQGQRSLAHRGPRCFGVVSSP